MKQSPVPTAPQPHQGTQGKRALSLDKSAVQGVQLELTGAYKGSTICEQPAYFRLVAANFFAHGCPGGGGNTPARAARTGTRRG